MLMPGYDELKVAMGMGVLASLAVSRKHRAQLLVGCSSLKR